ncbi:hypothetical protein HK104_008759 [Borealophlyctis nickersoniae]|nr:hypothetical protein HK104_008759 [Borealophlyctis nickersoniae]
MARLSIFLLIASAASWSANALPQPQTTSPAPEIPVVLVPSIALDTIKACPNLPRRPSEPTSVHDLRMDDIKVIAALGDSITAGWFAKGLPEKKFPFPVNAINEDRGIAFSMGGDPNAVTLPNLMKRYQPDLVGASTGSHFPEICYGILCFPFQYKPEQDQLNAAQSAAMVVNLEHELDYLERQLKNRKDVNFEKDWKLINLLIGSNDACLGCLDLPVHPTPDQYAKLMRSLITDIRKRIPRVVVNVMQQFNVSQVWDLTNKDPWCASLRNIGLIFECNCAFLPGPQGPTTRILMDTLVQNYNKEMEKIVEEIRNDKTREDYDSFAIVMDPMFSGVSVKEWPIAMLSDVDCFHPGIRAHEIMAVALW